MTTKQNITSTYPLGSEGVFHQLLEAAPDAIIIVSRDGRMLLVNNETLKLFGYERDELLDQPVEVLVPMRFRPDHAQKRATYADDAVNRPMGTGLEIFGRHKDGREIPMDIKLSPLKTESDLLVIAAIRDVTETKNKERLLEDTNTLLKQKNQELEQFAYVASHDLQEPLRKITAFGDRLKLKFAAELGDQGQDYLERMQRAARRMSLLISDLLDYSRLSTKAQPLVPVDLNDVVKGVVSDLEFRIEQVGGKIELGSLPVIDADEFQLRQLFQNLLANALKFHGEAPPVIRIGADLAPPPDDPASPRWIRISVSDNGIGFDEQYAQRIFTIFERLHSHSTFEGTGIGLAICRRIVERHGGTLEAHGEPGIGATFTISLPMSNISYR